MKKIDENKLARAVCWHEGRKVNLDIAQVKEVVRLTLDELAYEADIANMAGVVALVEKHLNELRP